ncbi:MAG TPA: hypothetical protein VK927_04735, partial [Adhaeribacter sp.]|nr:hypothetical protein [Adhaeribacter sp.]
ALIISIGSLMVFYLGLRSVFRFPVAFIATVGSGLSYYALYYAVNGRAYSLMLLCTGLAALALLKIYEQQENRYWLVFILASIAGFFAVPVFLYPFAAMVFFGAFSFFITRNRSGFFNLVLATFFAGVATLLLYLPIMLVSGPEQLFGNEYVVRLSREVFLQKLPVYLPYTQGAVLGQETVGFYGWLAAVLLLSLLLLFRKRLRNFWQENGLTPGRVFWVWCGSVIPWLIMLGQGVLPPDRVWLFKAFFDFLLLGIAAQATIGLVFRAQPTWWFSAAVLLTLVYGSYEVIKLRRSVQGNTILDGPFDRNIERIRQGGAKTVASSEGFYAAFLRYHYLQHGQENLIIDEVDQLSGQPYDVVILEPNHLFPEALDQADYELVHQDQFVRIFRRKPRTKN